MLNTIIILLLFIWTYYLIIFGKSRKSVVAFSMGILALFVKVSENMTIKNISYFVDFNTLGILFGMMIIVGVMKSTGMFQAIAGFIVLKSKGKMPLIFSFTLLTVAVLSSILDNVTTLLLFTPVILLICNEAGIKPELFIFPMIFAANIGGTATMIGDPPNILISSASQKSFIEFLVVMIIPTVIVFIISLIYFFIREKEMFHVTPERFQNLLKIEPKKAITDFKLLKKCLVVFFLVILGFIIHEKFHYEASLVALSGAAVILLISNLSFEEISKEIEWDTLFFFFGLFTLVKAMEDANLISYVTNSVSNLSSAPLLLILTMLWVSGILSAFIGAVPVATIFIPVVASLVNVVPLGGELWWALALGASFGGNGTISGSAANLVVVGMMESNFKTKVSFNDFMKKGMVITFIGLSFSSLYLIIRYLILK
jgi:Na+/H+ antiporter NhaD/arsenite permease-like protein